MARVSAGPSRRCPLVVCVLFALTAAVGRPAAAEPAGEPVSGGPGTAERHWHTSLTPALDEAARDGKLVFVDLFADWCGWCRVLDRTVFSRPVFDQLARKMVLVRLDVEDGAEGSRTQALYEVTGLPTTLILEASGALVGQVTGVAEPAEYVRNIEHQIELHRRMVTLYRRVVASGGETASEDVAPERVLALAESFHKRRDGARAAALYRLLEERGWSNPRGAALLPFRLADALRLKGRYAEAARSAARARELAVEQGTGRDSAALVEAIDLLGIQIAQEQGDCAERRQALQSFLRRHPESAYHRRVESSLSALETGTDGTGCS